LSGTTLVSRPEGVLGTSGTIKPAGEGDSRILDTMQQQQRTAHSYATIINDNQPETLDDMGHVRVEFRRGLSCGSKSLPALVLILFSYNRRSKNEKPEWTFRVSDM